MKKHKVDYSLIRDAFAEDEVLVLLDDVVAVTHGNCSRYVVDQTFRRRGWTWPTGTAASAGGDIGGVVVGDHRCRV